MSEVVEALQRVRSEGYVPEFIVTRAVIDDSVISFTAQREYNGEFIWEGPDDVKPSLKLYRKKGKFIGEKREQW